jgi:hypothetical protein
MKEMILLLAMQFSQDFGVPVDNITYRVGVLEHIAISRKTKSGYEITVDSDLLKVADYERIKTVVYHMTGKATGMDTVSTKKHFMNPDCILKPYKKLNHEANRRITP